MRGARANRSTRAARRAIAISLGALALFFAGCTEEWEEYTCGELAADPQKRHDFLFALGQRIRGGAGGGPGPDPKSLDSTLNDVCRNEDRSFRPAGAAEEKYISGE